MDELMQRLSDAIAKNGLKNKDVEEKIGLPKNSLSNFLKGNKDLPKKFALKTESYVIALEETSTTKAYFEEKPTNDEVENLKNTIQTQNKTISDLQAENRRLVRENENLRKLPKKNQSEDNSGGVQDLNPKLSKYDPMQNPIYRAKMGLK